LGETVDQDQDQGFVVTREWIKANSSSRGGAGHTAVQLEAIGVEWPPRQGWQARAHGRRISQDERRRFESESYWAMRRPPGERVYAARERAPASIPGSKLVSDPAWLLGQVRSVVADLDGIRSRLRLIEDALSEVYEGRSDTGR
jgi:hypothetical protein